MADLIEDILMYFNNSIGFDDKLVWEFVNENKNSTEFREHLIRLREAQYQESN